MASLTILYWRDIPAQVIAKAGRKTAKRQLPERFEQAIDRAAMRAKLTGTDAYLEQWRKSEPRPCADDLDAVVDRINATGYGLTMGVHTRIDETWQRVAARARVGNVYVNRNMVGAVVGVQPFGGSGLSGTGPKAGGPAYLHRFSNERTLTINTSAVGGNASLLSLSDG